jgi:ATP-dependent RNA helicase SUPV3L1/SUV3
MPSTTPHAPHASPLPDPRHASRVPADVSPEQLERVRKAAFNLPQVLKPADFATEDIVPSDEHLHHLGLILLQKGVQGSRPSRWIAPQALHAALEHLAAFDNGSKLRGALNDRTAQLESLGITRLGAGWQRLCTQPLKLSDPAWKLSTAYTVPVASDIVWAFFRNGDKAALRKALGTPPAWPQADELAAHIDHLLRRSDSFAPAQVDSLLPRLQAECAQPHPLPELKAACTRVQDRWEHRVAEQQTLRGLHADLAFQGYPDTFEKARKLQRSVTLFVGPPNSGKTHAAFERLAQAHDGCYLAPLRLLALEGRDRLVGRGVACSLLTGEENVPAPGARVVSSTIEMLSTSKPVEVAVIDEAQMIFDASRGWAWTQAIVGVPANELLIICSAYAVPAIENLLRLCGESCTVRHFERKQHVELLHTPVSLQALKKGDAVVAFSRRDVLMLRDQIGAMGHPVSVIYGALPPEVRRREAERFAQGDTDVLVATDAIGMGLNLPIRRVIFSTMTKFDGETDRPLTESEVHQIAGRAGRYGMHEEGFAGVLKEAEPGALHMLQELLHKPQRAPRNFKAPVAPNWWHVDTIATRLHLKRLHEVLKVFVSQLQLDSTHFQVAELEQMLELAEQIDRVAVKLPLKERFIYAQAPVDTRTEGQMAEFLDWVANHAVAGRAGEPWFLQQVDEHSRLDRMEQALRACTLWLWLDLRFPGVFGHVEDVIDLRSRLNDGIERQLKGKRPLAQVRKGMRRR